MRLSILPFLAVLSLLAGGVVPQAGAQILERQAIPFSVWLDFDTLSGPKAPSVPLPIWLESIKAERGAPRPGAEEQTIYRLRLRHVGLLSREISMRVFFEDLPGIAPMVTGWTETGLQRYSSGALGNGLGLSSSETLIVPAGSVDYLELTVPGNGSTIRGLFLSSVQFTETRLALDFPIAKGRLADPFGSPAPLVAPANDRYLFGRVQATLQAEPSRVTAAAPAAWEVELDDSPMLAVLSFEVLNADLSRPPEVTINGQATAAVSLQLPDLADPAYRANSAPGEADPRMHYSGWLRAQIVLPGSLWQKGENQLELKPGTDQNGPIAIRSVELQLKNLEIPPGAAQ